MLSLCVCVLMCENVLFSPELAKGETTAFNYFLHGLESVHCYCLWTFSIS